VARSAKLRGVNRDEIQQRKEEIERQFGPWTAMDIDLGHGIATRTGAASASGSGESSYRHERSDWSGYSPTSSRISRIVQLIADLARKPISELRILDLACLEGGFAIELGARGATAVGIDGRRGHIAKAEFARNALGLPNVTFAVDDVRNVTRARYGGFDVVLCLGILYHLAERDLFPFARAITDCSDHLLVVDTVLTIEAPESSIYDGRTYHGLTTPEHQAKASASEIEENAWMSIDNSTNFLLSRFSLYNLFTDLGFSSAYECFLPPVLGHGARSTFVAVKGARQTLLTAAHLAAEEERYRETDSGASDSELHLVARELTRLRRNPLAAFWSFFRRAAGNALRRSRR
jgi:hypothetical protein